jgi:hypothetical protein
VALLSWLVVIGAVTTPALAANKSAKEAVKPSPPTIIIRVDATEAPRKILHAQMSIPATTGTLTLYYPKCSFGAKHVSGGQRTRLGDTA